MSTEDGHSRLSRADLEAIAAVVCERVAEILGRTTPRYVDASALAEMLDVDRDWVYDHATELGGVRLGGPRGRLRFDIERVQCLLMESNNAAAPNRTRKRSQEGARFLRAPLIDYEH